MSLSQTANPGMTGGGATLARVVQESAQTHCLKMRGADRGVEVGVLIVPPRRAVATVEEPHGPEGIAGPA